MQYGSKANLSTKSCSDISELEKKLVREIAQKLSKKLVETKNVALYTRSCQTTKCQLVGSPREKGVGEGGRLKGYSKLCSERLRSEVQSLTLICTIFHKRYHFRVSSIEKLYPFHISAS